MSGGEYHENALALNCGRNCLAYFIKAHEINRIWLPKLICDTIVEICQTLQVEIRWYSINQAFLPDEDMLGNDWGSSLVKSGYEQRDAFFLVNYYGQVPVKRIIDYSRKIPNLVVDNCQAFFQQALPGMSTIYSARKFFAVADGAYLYTDQRLQQNFPTDDSSVREKLLPDWYENNDEPFFSEEELNTDIFGQEPIKKMSVQTHNRLSKIDYAKEANIREINFRCLNELLAKNNALSLQVPVGPFMYPFLHPEGGRIREILEKEEIFIPPLWPEVLRRTKSSEPEFKIAQNLLTLPIDARYDRDDMEYMADSIEAALAK